MPDHAPPIPDNEFERVLRLSEYDIDYSEIHGELDDLTRLAAYVAGTPISLVNLLDTTTLWTLSSHGLDLVQTLREDTVSQYVILNDDPVEVEDMTQDERFKHKEYVTGDPHIRYYYGIPLTTPDGHNIGAMCVMDTNEYNLQPEKQEFLKIIANEVITRIEYEHKLKLIHQNVDELKEAQRKISHDIRGPISGIIGMSGILKDEAEENKMMEFLEMIELINKGGRSVLELADEILANNKEQAQSDKISKDQLTLLLLKEKLENLYQPQALNKSIDYTVTLDDENQDFAFPKYKLLQILGNLISNAIKFTSKEGSVDVSLCLQKPDIALAATVKNTGMGMAQEQIDALQTGKGNTTEGTTRELGFQLVQHLVDSMNGTVNIESTPGQGSNITVNIPLD